MALLIEIFRAGRHTAMGGESVSFTEANLDEVVQSYDPARHEAPIVIGHPRADAPAYGWVRGLTRKGAALEASVDQVDPAFSELVRSGRFKKVSASFYLPSSPSNPTPGKLSLRHVGFLGAQPPAVKGLKQVSFAGGDKDTLTVEFAQGDLGDIVKRLRAWIEEKVGAEAAAEATVLSELEAAVTSAPAAPDGEVSEQVAEAIVDEATSAAVDAVVETLDVPADKKVALEAAIEEAIEQAVEAAGAGGSVSHSERRRQPRKPAPRSPRERELDQREAELQRREKELRRTEHVSYLEGLVRDGRPLPCARETALAFLELLEGVETGVVSFGEREKRHPVDIFKAEILGRLPRQVDFSERAGGAAADADDTADDLARRAAEYQAAQAASGRTITTAEAVRHVAKGAK